MELLSLFSSQSVESDWGSGAYIPRSLKGSDKPDPASHDFQHHHHLLTRRHCQDVVTGYHGDALQVR